MEHGLFIFDCCFYVTGVTDRIKVGHVQDLTTEEATIAAGKFLAGTSWRDGLDIDRLFALSQPKSCSWKFNQISEHSTVQFMFRSRTFTPMTLLKDLLQTIIDCSVLLIHGTYTLKQVLVNDAELLVIEDFFGGQVFGRSRHGEALTTYNFDLPWEWDADMDA